MHPSTRTTNELFFRLANAAEGSWGLVHKKSDDRLGELTPWSQTSYASKAELAYDCWLRWGLPELEWDKKDDGVWWCSTQAQTYTSWERHCVDIQLWAVDPSGRELGLPALIDWGAQVAASRGEGEWITRWGPRRFYPSSSMRFWNGEGPVPGTGCGGCYRRLRSRTGRGSLAREASGLLLECTLLNVRANVVEDDDVDAFGQDEADAIGPAWCELPTISKNSLARLRDEGRRMMLDLPGPYDDAPWRTRQGAGWKVQGKTSQGGRADSAKRGLGWKEGPW